MEDLHWADEATLQTLDRLARHLEHTGLLLVGTARPHPRPAGLHTLERTLAQVDAAAVLAEAGERDRAAELLGEALDLWDGAGARRGVARVRQALRALGVRRGRGLAAERPASGWGSLTDTEWRVVALVAESLIYRDIAERLFVSRRTVETHAQACVP